ncbi:PREDICTED: doublesex- and mab-3-related transcription factor A1 [Miniopterus natalensis]|uniref:doublesex- and mab-3-related transcription factor A1 n=1 Tax=Miniopterus natalensis TaxID=291302 RepID=UPI0007A6F076|nr:PREDICTED: doublesex- and mab-3-related transcription factor A1 [Miniopterus natalensis]
MSSHRLIYEEGKVEGWADKVEKKQRSGTETRRLRLEVALRPIWNKAPFRRATSAAPQRRLLANADRAAILRTSCRSKTGRENPTLGSSLLLRSAGLGRGGRNALLSLRRAAGAATPAFQVFQPEYAEEKQEQKESKCDSFQSGLKEPASKSHHPTLGSPPKATGVTGKQNLRSSVSQNSNKHGNLLFSPSGDQSGGEESPRSLSSSDRESGNESEWARNFPAPRARLRSVSSSPRDPLDILTKIFPGHRRSRLEGILHICGGDVVQAIEQVLSGKEQPPGPRGPRGLASPGELGCAAFQTASHCSLAALGLGALGNKSAFSPLHTASAAYGGDAGLYSLGPRLGVSPLRLAYPPPGRGLAGLMAPYLTPGLVPALPFHPALDYAFPGMIRDSSYHPSKDSVTASRLYSRLNQDDL